MNKLTIGEDVTIGELAETVKQVVGYKGEIVIDASKPNGTPRKLMDVARLNNLSWRTPAALKTGLAEAYRDFEERHA